jgi:hypothetical protein
MRNTSRRYSRCAFRAIRSSGLAKTTADLTVHEQTAWMLRSLLQD